VADRSQPLQGVRSPVPGLLRPAWRARLLTARPVGSRSGAGRLGSGPSEPIGTATDPGAGDERDPARHGSRLDGSSDALAKTGKAT
jgi:hypothetical protein